MATAMELVPDCPEPRQHLSKQQQEAINKPKNKRNYKDLVHIQSVYGRSLIPITERQKELKRKVQRTNTAEFPLANIHTFSTVVQETCIKSEWTRPEVYGQHLLDESYIWVNTNSRYWQMHKHLEDQDVIMVDIECHDGASYSGVICLVQISTNNYNFVIDALALPQEISVNLKKVLENPNILKVMHGAGNDIKWLQRDFMTFLWPLYDTQKGYQFFTEKDPDSPDPSDSIGFAELVKRLLRIEITNEEKTLGQLSDYSKRPLHKDLVVYAANDTRYLLHAFEIMKTKHDFEKGFAASKKLWMVSKWNGKAYPSADQDLMKKNISVPSGYYQQFNRLHKYRNKQAKSLDVKPEDVLSTAELVSIASGNIKTANVSNKSLTNFVMVAEIGKESPQQFTGRCYRCNKFAGHVAAFCNDEKTKKVEAESEYYQDNPEKLNDEKARVKEKRSKRRQAEAKAKKNYSMN